MNLKKICLFLLLLVITSPCWAGSKYESKISSLEGEKWWGGMVGLGSQMPFKNDMRLFDLSAENLNNQNVPLLLSSEGRYIWSDKPFSFKIEGGNLHLFSDYGTCVGREYVERRLYGSLYQIFSSFRAVTGFFVLFNAAI